MVLNAQQNANLPMHVVYIFGVASHEGQEDARAGWATDWGPRDSKNKSGVAEGRKTQLRAELTAVKSVLEQAHNSSIREVTIMHRSDGLAQELDRWNSTTYEEEYTFDNKNLLWDIGRYKSSVKFTIEQSPPGPQPLLEYKNVMLLAKRIAGLHSTAAVTVTDTHWLEGTRVVDIAGFSRVEEGEERSGYGIVWAKDDPRNRTGAAIFRQNTYRAELTALKATLETAKAEGIDEIVIRSRGILLHKLINFREEPGRARNGDLLRANMFLFESFSFIRHLLPPKEIDVPGLNQASRMARDRCGVQKIHVSIHGIGTEEKSGITAFGIYWSPTNPKNTSGWIRGSHGSFCVEMSALGTLLEDADPNKNLVVYSSCEQLKKFVHEWRYDWKQGGCKPIPGASPKCVEVFKTVDEMLDKTSVQVILTNERNVPKARELAEAARHSVTIHTVGLLQGGNNEPAAWYAVFFGAGDKRNECGQLPGLQCPVKAKQYAIRRALEIALQNGVKKVTVHSDYSEQLGEDRKLQLEIKILSERLELVQFKKDITTEAFELAERTLN